MKSVNGVYKDKCYRPVNGITTGGSISVQLDSIAVYYVLYNTVLHRICNGGCVFHKMFY